MISRCAKGRVMAMVVSSPLLLGGNLFLALTKVQGQNNSLWSYPTSFASHACHYCPFLSKDVQSHPLFEHWEGLCDG